MLTLSCDLRCWTYNETIVITLKGYNKSNTQIWSVTKELYLNNLKNNKNEFNSVELNTNFSSEETVSIMMTTNTKSTDTWRWWRWQTRSLNISGIKKDSHSALDLGYRGRNYRGCKTTTLSGKTCQKWSSQSPHGHTRTPQTYSGMGLGDHNYCRNPDNMGGGPWCYTTDRTKRWEYCFD